MTDAEANRIIAERLFGWEIIEGFFPGTATDGSAQPESTLGRPPGSATTERIWPFTHRPDSVFGPDGVVEKLQNLGNVVQWETSPTKYHLAAVHQFGVPSEARKWFYGYTPSQAVAYAAAAALSMEGV